MSDFDKFMKLMKSFGVKTTVFPGTKDKDVTLEGDKKHGHSGVNFVFNLDGKFKSIDTYE